GGSPFTIDKPQFRSACCGAARRHGRRPGAARAGRSGQFTQPPRRQPAPHRGKERLHAAGAARPRARRRRQPGESVWPGGAHGGGRRPSWHARIASQKCFLKMPERYDKLAITLHWVVAALVLCQISLGWWMLDLPKSPPGLRAGWFNVHKSIGLTIGLLVLFRLAWRIGHLQ